jgi:hypothetical protein
MFKHYVFGHYPPSCLYLKSVLFIFQNTAFWILDSVSVFRYNLLSWAQMIELVPVSGQILDKDKTMDNVQKHNICTSVLSSQTCLLGLYCSESEDGNNCFRRH